MTRGPIRVDAEGGTRWIELDEVFDYLRHLVRRGLEFVVYVIQGCAEAIGEIRRALEAEGVYLRIVGRPDVPDYILQGLAGAVAGSLLGAIGGAAAGWAARAPLITLASLAIPGATPALIVIGAAGAGAAALGAVGGVAGLWATHMGCVIRVEDPPRGLVSLRFASA